MKVSDFIIEYLSRKTGVIFGGQGGSIVHIADSIDRNKKLKFIPGQNEQASSMAADAYHRTSGRLGVCIATSGPGVLNLLQGIACSYFDSIPSLYISGAPVTSQIRKNKKIRQIGFQEMEVVDLVKPITKYATLVKNVNDIKYELDKAIYIANEGRKGPVLIDIPDDIQRQEIQKNNLRKFKLKKKEHKLLKKTKGQIIKLAKYIEKARRPLFIIGNGIKLSKSEKILKKIIKKTGIPYAPTWATVDMFKSEDLLNAGTFGVAATRHGNFSIQNSDLLVFLGSRLSPQIVGGNMKIFSPKSKKFLIDIDKHEFKNHRLERSTIKIHADVKKTLEFLYKKKFIINRGNIKKWIYLINSYKKRFPITPDKNFDKRKFVDPYFFFQELSAVTSEKDIIIPDASANLIWFMQGYKINLSKQKIFTALNHSPMGYSVPASIGAYFGAKQKKQIIAVIGDGSIQMNIQELETIKNYRVDVKIFVINNNGYGLIKQTQETWLKSNYVGVDRKSGLSLPNFLHVAKAYKIKTKRLDSNKNLKVQLKNILKFRGPLLIDLVVNPKARVMPKIDFGKPLHEMSPLLSKKLIKSIII